MKISFDKNSRGFTLLEVLIALFIFVIVAALTSAGLYSVFSSKQGLTQANKQLRDLQLTMAILEQDFTQIIARPIMIDQQQKQLALNGHESIIEFTRSGFSNPFAEQKRSQLQRVTYFVSDGNLIRQTWPVVDRVSTTKPEKKVLLSQVNQINFHYLDKKKRIYSSWPPPHPRKLNIGQPKPQPFPLAIEITLASEKHGKITLLFNTYGKSTHG